MAEERQVVVETVQLTKLFRDFWMRPKVKALDRVEFQVFRGEIFGLLGPNGSGKSTLLKILLGLLFPTQGRAAVFGRDPRNLAIKDRIGFMPEESYLYRYLNAEETLDFYGRLFNLPAAERRHRVELLLEMVGLTHQRKRPIVEYSKGMARRIGLAQALINDPDLIFLDEPTTGLDPTGTREIKDLILELRRAREDRAAVQPPARERRRRVRPRRHSLRRPAAPPRERGRVAQPPREDADHHRPVERRRRLTRW